MKKLSSLILVCLVTLSPVSPVKSINNGGKSVICFAASAGLLFSTLSILVMAIPRVDEKIRESVANGEKNSAHYISLNRQRTLWIFLGEASVYAAGASAIAGCAFAGIALFNTGKTIARKLELVC